ncbi:uncharacterized protein [Diadema antillarum]|uniref:uncharacterized protein n=1 Tax=Diadema antillarum TaxID=105358 RepID=UPI003A8BC1B8
MDVPKRRRGRPSIPAEERMARKRISEAKYKDKRREKERDFRRVRLPIDTFNTWREVRESSGAGTDGAFAERLLNLYQAHRRQGQLDTTGTQDGTRRRSRKSKPLKFSSPPSVQRIRPSCEQDGWSSDTPSPPSSIASVSIPECEDLQALREEEDRIGEDRREEKGVDEEETRGAQATPAMSKSGLRAKANAREGVDVESIVISKTRLSELEGQVANHRRTSGTSVTTTHGVSVTTPVTPDSDTANHVPLVDAMDKAISAQEELAALAPAASLDEMVKRDLKRWKKSTHAQ